ncbi:galactose mutarotase [Robiginitalea sp. M366]|uniref:aldose epimerase family protein n=1 Tax=Robiginitalea aestuariiviva TaxID=3036903 RepID=UPI00240D47CD|nr:aldose epimerase family protein [Robiginitalea aestuariiviva]MDG1572012.1 galactose mutarotase [Robiginitalea aestuariiviva]
MKHRNSITTILLLLLLGALSTGCKDKGKADQKQHTMTQQAQKPGIESHFFGPFPAGGQVTRYTLRNARGMEVDILNYGGIITRWTAPDRDGNYQDVVLGFDRLAPYLERHPYFGALIGRYGNRIAQGSFQLDGKTYTLAKNNGENHLHGGEYGFDRVLWEVTGQSEGDTLSLSLGYLSPDGEEGYPGNLQVEVTYSLTPDNELIVDYQASTDAPTVVNLTQHTYFNLSGNFQQPITDHELQLDAPAYLPVDQGLIPTGDFQPVAGTPFDFTQPKAIGAEIDAPDPQLQVAGGYDHCWVLDEGRDSETPAAKTYHPGSGRQLEVFTEEPGIQVYTSNFLNGDQPAKGGGYYPFRGGLCLETQHLPDSPNRPEFPSTRLDPGQTYHTQTRFKFTTR